LAGLQAKQLAQCSAALAIAGRLHREKIQRPGFYHPKAVRSADGEPPMRLYFGQLE
jgi:hypothetical protein